MPTATVVKELSLKCGSLAGQLAAPQQPVSIKIEEGGCYHCSQVNFFHFWTFNFTHVRVNQSHQRIICNEQKRNKIIK